MRDQEGSQDLMGQDQDRKEIHWCDLFILGYISPPAVYQFLSCEEVLKSKVKLGAEGPKR